MCMSPTFNGSSALQRFERSNAIEIRNRIISTGTATTEYNIPLLMSHQIDLANKIIAVLSHIEEITLHYT